MQRENENILLKIYRDYTESEAINLLKQEVASLLFEIGQLKSEKCENNWLSLQDLKEVRISKAQKELDVRNNKKMEKLKNTISTLRKEKDFLLSKIYTNELQR